MIIYATSLQNITPDKLHGFFVGWPKPPTPETHLKILNGSSHIVLAIDNDTRLVVGFVNAVSDGVLAAYMPLLEVLPEYQKRGIGAELMRRILAMLDGFYMADLVCDDDLRAFYERFGMRSFLAMGRRQFDRQHGE
jgi:ribosomal protein S18 acetylase RimI-like enzyme